MNKKKITVETTIEAPIKKAYSSPLACEDKAQCTAFGRG